MDVYIKSFCPYCQRLLELLEKTDMDYRVYDIVSDVQAHDTMMQLSGDKGVPQVHIKNVIIYDYDTEETLVEDIHTISGYDGVIDAAWMKNHTTSTAKIDPTAR